MGRYLEHQINEVEYWKPRLIEKTGNAFADIKNEIKYSFNTLKSKKVVYDNFGQTVNLGSKIDYSLGCIKSEILDVKTPSFVETAEDIGGILKSENKIEIRFITSPSFENRNEYTILTFNKKWSAKYYYYKPDTNNLFSKDINAKIDIDTIFSRLVSNNIFSLPDQHSLKTEKYEYNPETNKFIGQGIAFVDGTCYYIEFKVGDFYRRYCFYNPDSYADFYPQVYELRNFANIVEIFKELMKE